ncbi:hypothetical protein SAMN04487770_102160 [Butyrivibrio sp. ob235]|uniref:hypothetical protein n=1 Tax=Butyrivibrio sp. ob235 TaxID=1761780 RepID=UPI0008AA88AE|nr:hypothetical protein [Butyrivibrio sp. ob235]SEK64481.1 hypothetical protein SAMN04487770_102160 [Butyrivibrio sp. ob235]
MIFAGAALGTILSEALVMIVCGYNVYGMLHEKKADDDIARDNNEYISSDVVRRLIVVGLPMALQSVITGFVGCRGIYYGEITAWIFANLILISAYYYELHFRVSSREILQDSADSPVQN